MLSAKNEKIKGHRVHFLGIGGIGMSALAKQLYQIGFDVSGSDVNPLGAKNLLCNDSIVLNGENCIENSDTIVVSSAIGENDKQLLQAKKLGKNIIYRAQLLNELSKNCKEFIGVAGTHGKTTVTSMIAHVLKAADANFTAHIGGLDSDFSNYASFGNDIFLAEICEYKKNIRYFSPDIALVLNADNDHLESYGNFSALREEFISYLNRSKTAVFCDECNFKVVKNAVVFSVKNSKCDYCIQKNNSSENSCEYTVYEHGARLFNIDLSNFTPHDSYNVIAVTAASRQLKISGEIIKKGILSFRGIKRRNEIICKWDKGVLIADYAHHPKQIELAITEYQRKYGNDCIFLFQPHTFSRTRDLFADFVKALSPASKLYLFKTYAARERYDETGSSERLASALKNAVFCGEVEACKSIVNRLIGGDNSVIVLGAGDIYDHVIKSF